MPESPLPDVVHLANPPRTGAVAIGVVRGSSGPTLPKSVGSELVAGRGFEAKPGQTLVLPGSPTRILVGLGERSAISADGLRSAAASAARAAWNETSLALDLLTAAPARVDRTLAVKAIVEGALLALYSFTKHKRSGSVAKVKRVCVVAPAGRAVEAGIARGVLSSEAVRYARDLVNEPPGTMTPSVLAAEAARWAQECGLALRVWDEHDLERERCGGLRGVSLGSDEPPRLIRLEYQPKATARHAGRTKVPTIAIVGKGITFDSGGLSLKTADGMMTMKCDMSGAAAVLAVMRVIGRMAPAVAVIGYAVCTENLPGPKAIKPGDVLTARNGTTIEVLNTDAEGRLALADGLALAAEDRADAIVDIATLTGAQVVALGTDITAVLGNNEAFTAQVLEAGARGGEDLWELPLAARYRRLIDSPVADLKNIGPPGRAGTILAALFLREFVGNRPWAHLDIAGPAFTDAEDGINSRGGTGASVRTLIELIMRFERP